MISILLPDLRGGGAERVSIDLANSFADAGHAVEFVLLQEQGDFLPEVAERHSLYCLQAERARNAVLPLSRYLRQRRPEALIAAMWPLTFCAPLAASLSGHRCPVLAVEHNTLSRQYAGRGRAHRAALRLSLALGYRLADAVGGVSRGAAEDAARLAFYPAAKSAVLYNPIHRPPPPSAEQIARAESYWKRPRGKRIIAVGSLKAQKNHRLLLQAFHRLDDPDACLLILGQGALEGELAALADTLGIADRVSFAGFHDDPTPFYATADQFALSSDYEGFANVVVEALACGLPVVSTDCPWGPAEILENGRYGTLTPVGDVDALSAALHEGFTAGWDASALKRRAEDFSPDKAARRYLETLGLKS